MNYLFFQNTLHDQKKDKGDMNERGARLFDGKREKRAKHLTEGDVEKFGHDKGKSSNIPIFM